MTHFSRHILFAQIFRIEFVLYTDISNKNSIFLKQKHFRSMFSADKIDDTGLWLGDITASENLAALEKYQISHILTILDYQPKSRDKNRTYLHIHADDLQSTDLITTEFDKCYEFINQAIKQGHQVLIHCHAGVSRSATIVAMYLMRKYSLTREQALERISQKRRFWTVMPNAGFLKQLDLFHQMNYHVDIEHDLYKQFQQDKYQRQITTTPEVVFSSNDDDDQRDYQCRCCRWKLFTNNDIQKHEDQSKAICSNPNHVFTFYLDWIDDIFQNSSGKISCPNCQTVLGEYSLQGIRCTCHQYMKPAFAFERQSIEIS